jgi:hypothetical protein
MAVELLLEPVSKLKMLYISNHFVMPGLTRHPVNNGFYWIPAFAGMTNWKHSGLVQSFPRTYLKIKNAIHQ